jgi:hypothetical protein
VVVVVAAWATVVVVVDEGGIANVSVVDVVPFGVGLTFEA